MDKEEVFRWVDVASLSEQSQRRLKFIAIDRERMHRENMKRGYRTYTDGGLADLYPKYY